MGIIIIVFVLEYKVRKPKPQQVQAMEEAIPVEYKVSGYKISENRKRITFTTIRAESPTIYRWG